MVAVGSMKPKELYEYSERIQNVQSNNERGFLMLSRFLLSFHSRNLYSSGQNVKGMCLLGLMKILLIFVEVCRCTVDEVCLVDVNFIAGIKERASLVKLKVRKGF